MSYACKHCGTVIMEDDTDLCHDCSHAEKVRTLPYYKRFIEFPNEPRPNEPCNDFEHPERWALVAYWEKSMADQAAAQIATLQATQRELVEVLEPFAMIELHHGFPSLNLAVIKARDALAKIKGE